MLASVMPLGTRILPKHLQPLGGRTFPQHLLQRTEVDLLNRLVDQATYINSFYTDFSLAVKTGINLRSQQFLLQHPPIEGWQEKFISPRILLKPRITRMCHMRDGIQTYDITDSQDAALRTPHQRPSKYIHFSHCQSKSLHALQHIAGGENPHAIADKVRCIPTAHYPLAQLILQKVMHNFKQLGLGIYTRYYLYQVHITRRVKEMHAEKTTAKSRCAITGQFGNRQP